jgi:hypothetical protein
MKTIQDLIKHLQAKFPQAEVFESVDNLSLAHIYDKIFCVREILGYSNFGKNSFGEEVKVPIFKTTRFTGLRILVSYYGFDMR